MSYFMLEEDFMIDGYRCIVLGLKAGHRCGYVALPKSHRLYGKGYCRINVKVHGGLTYGDVGNDHPIQTKEKQHWIGFDTGHVFDKVDFDLLKKFDDNEDVVRYYKDLYALGDRSSMGKVRSAAYVKDQLIDVVKQLKVLDQERKSDNDSSRTL